MSVSVTVIKKEDKKLRGNEGTWEEVMESGRDGNNAETILMYEILKI